jgi:hypothetical protein
LVPNLPDARRGVVEQNAIGDLGRVLVRDVFDDVKDASDVGPLDVIRPISVLG